jgi:hypothetical protein
VLRSWGSGFGDFSPSKRESISNQISLHGLSIRMASFQIQEETILSSFSHTGVGNGELD